jgi:hypothetical protein
MQIFLKLSKREVFAQFLMKGIITSEKVLEVMKSIDRADFISYQPYIDTP